MFSYESGEIDKLVYSVSHSLKKGRVLARKRALLMREIHPKGHRLLEQTFQM